MINLLRLVIFRFCREDKRRRASRTEQGNKNFYMNLSCKPIVPKVSNYRGLSNPFLRKLIGVEGATGAFLWQYKPNDKCETYYTSLQLSEFVCVSGALVLCFYTRMGTSRGKSRPQIVHIYGSCGHLAHAIANSVYGRQEDESLPQRACMPNTHDVRAQQNY